MKKKKYYTNSTIFVVLLLLLGALLYYVFADPAKSWHCSPTKPRGNDVEIWEKTITPAQTSVEPNEYFFDKFIVSSDLEHFTIEHPSENPPDKPFAFELKELMPGEPLEIRGGTLELSCIGTAYHDANQMMEDDAIYHFYDARLQSISDTGVGQRGIDKTTEDGASFRYNPWPAVQIAFQYENIEDLMFHGIKIFDCHTCQSLESGYSSIGRVGSHRLRTHIPLWHRTPVDIVIDVSFGPSKTFEFAPRAGEGFNEGNFRCRLLYVFDGVDFFSFGSSTYQKTVTHEFRKVPPDKAGLRFFFACQPTANHMPVTFEFLDKDGNRIELGGGSTSGYTHQIAIQQPLEKIALIRAKYHTKRYRIVVHLPYIPGLPEKNEKIDDLFDVHIPYVRLHGSSQVDQFLRHTLQLSGSSSTGLTPRNSILNYPFPLDFHDVTLRDIAKVYATGGRLYVDIENDQLRREYPKPLFRRLEQFLQKIFR